MLSITTISDESRGGGEPQSPPLRPFDPLRVVIAAFPGSVWIVRVRGALRRAGLDDERVLVIDPTAAGRRRRSSSPHLEVVAPNALVAFEDLGDADLETSCLDLLDDGHQLVVVLSETFRQRGRVEEILAELGGVVLGPEGRTYP